MHHGFGGSVLHVMEALGGPRERVLRRLAKDVIGEPFGPLNVLAIEVKAEPGARPIPFAPGLPDGYFEHDGQITKREIRSLTLSALRPAPGEMLWDIGLGSGSVAIEWLLCHASMRAIGFEKSAERAARAARNAASLGVPYLEIRKGKAPEALQGAEAPDAIFVGGGVSEPGLLAAAWDALKPGGRMVCNAVSFEGQAALMQCRAVRGGARDADQYRARARGGQLHGLAARAAGGAMGGNEAMAVIGIGTASRASVDDVLAVIAAAKGMMVERRFKDPLTPTLSPRGEGAGCGLSTRWRTIQPFLLPTGRKTG